MNRMVLTKLLKDIINLYIENKFTYVYIIDVFSKMQIEEYDEDQNAYYQAEVMRMIFEHIPYYRVLKELSDLGDYLIEVTKSNRAFKSTAVVLANGCLGDMIPDIKRRVLTETMTHITELLYIYNHNELTKELVINRLTKNMYNPILLTSMDTAENINYEQTTLPGLENKHVALRDTISRSNSNRKDRIRRNMEDYTIANFDEKNLEDFYTKVINFIEESELPDKDLLKEPITECLTNLFAKAVVAWDETPEDTNQLSLNFQ